MEKVNSDTYLECYLDSLESECLEIIGIESVFEIELFEIEIYGIECRVIDIPASSEFILGSFHLEEYPEKKIPENVNSKWIAAEILSCTNLYKLRPDYGFVLGYKISQLEEYLGLPKMLKNISSQKAVKAGLGRQGYKSQLTKLLYFILSKLEKQNVDTLVNTLKNRKKLENILDDSDFHVPEIVYDEDSQVLNIDELAPIKRKTLENKIALYKKSRLTS